YGPIRRGSAGSTEVQELLPERFCVYSWPILSRELSRQYNRFLLNEKKSDEINGGIEVGLCVAIEESGGA
ncbi:hypothetical protein, partial [Hydrogenimonas sp.]